VDSVAGNVGGRVLTSNMNTGVDELQRSVVDAWDDYDYVLWDEAPPDPATVEELDAHLQAVIAELEKPATIADEIAHVARLQHRRAELEAEEARTLVNLARMTMAEADPGADRGLAYRSLAAELAMACRLSDRTFQTRIDHAETLVEQFPHTLAALEDRSISVGHARVIVECGLPISDPDSRAKYEAAVLERAAEVTPGRLRKHARLAAEKLAEVAFEERHRLAREDRAVRLAELEDGMSELIATVPTVFAVPMLEQLTAQAKAVRAANPDEPRSLDQIRADLFCELILTGQPTGCPDAPHAAGIGIRAEVSIVIPVLTLLGKGQEPATIAGRGPIGMKDALRLAGTAAMWIRLLTDPIGEQLLAVDTYRPSQKLRRFIRARDGRCRCPWCSRAATGADLDHTLAWEHGGPTTHDNLACLCPGCHTLKHLPGWSVIQTSPGVLEWTSPHGIVATDHPDTPIRFK
jgi:hypothetical protein